MLNLKVHVQFVFIVVAFVVVMVVESIIQEIYGFSFSEVTLWVRILNSLISLANHVLETGPAFYNTVQGSEIFRIIRGKTS